MTPEFRFWPEEITIQISMVRHTRSAQTVQLSEGEADKNLVLYQHFTTIVAKRFVAQS